MRNSRGPHLNIRRTSEVNISLPDWMRTAASFRSFFICLRFCRATWPLQARERERDSVCVQEMADLPLWNKIDCTYYTRSHFKTLLNQVAEGWIPLNSLRSYCLLWSIALNPHRSSCGYQTHLFYEDSRAHNRLEVIKKPAVRFTSNLHLFHHYVIKEYIRIFMFICISLTQVWIIPFLYLLLN